MQHGFEKNNTTFSPEEIKKLIQSPEAKKLIAMLNQDGGKTLKKASEAAGRGEYEAVKQLLSPKLQGQEAEALLKKLEQKG